MQVIKERPILMSGDMVLATLKEKPTKYLEEHVIFS